MMKIAILAGMLALLAFDATSAIAQADETAKAGKKPASAKHRLAQPDPHYRQLEPYRSMGFIGAYPGGYARQKAAGECVIDLGYGRWESCNVCGAL